MKKVLSVVSLLIYGLFVCAPGAAIAGQNFTSIKGTPITFTAAGTLSFNTAFTATVVGGTSLTFNSNGSNLVATAPEAVKVTFNVTGPEYKAIIISTDNGQYTSGPNVGKDIGSGLIGKDVIRQEDSTKYTVPLHWGVFETQPDSNYAFSVFPTGTIKYKADGVTPDLDKNGKTQSVAGYVDNTLYPYVVDRSQDDFDAADLKVLGYASVIWDIQGTAANLANAPIGSGNFSDPDPNDNNSTYELPRDVDNGEAYIKIAADYHGAVGQDYETTTLSLDLITM